MKLEIGNWKFGLAHDLKLKNCRNSFLLIVLIFIVSSIPKNVCCQNLVPNLDLSSHWDGHTHIGVPPYNSLWGWTDTDGREYAILGSLDSIYFFDVTNPYKIRLCDARAGGAYKGSVVSSRNREFKTYKNYCYAVADAAYAGLQVYDLKYLPDSVHKVYDDITLSSNAHSLYIDGTRLYLSWNKRMQNGDNDIPVTVLSLKNPEIPTFISDLVAPVQDLGGGKTLSEFEYVHDLFVRNDTAYCCCGYDGMFIYDYKDSIHPHLLQTIANYIDAGYNHSCWLSTDGNLLVFTDETQYARVKLYDVSALKASGQRHLNEVCLFSSHATEGSIGHNAYMKGKLIYMSYYEDGVVVFDMSDSTNVHEVASYDTYPQNQPGQYHGTIGCWNIYPFFPSGTIIASDMENGLFVLRLDSVSAINSNYIACNTLNIKIIQNPFKENINLVANTSTSQKVEISLYDMIGKKFFSSDYDCFPGSTLINIPCPSRISGTIILTAKAGNCTLTRKLIQMEAGN